MSYPLTTSKIRDEHLDRYAYIYVRQSTLRQVRENTTSTQRQYDLTKLAADLGWSQEKIVVVDQDQARSGASTEGRNGFKEMLSEIALGNVGAVISLEASRLARDSSAWHQLLKICDVTNTLVIDEIGVYDPRDRDDRFLLGLKGTMSEAELNLIVSRMMGARQKKAEEGKLCFPLPLGLIYSPEGKIVLDPDEEIQNSIRLLFDTFDRCSSVRMMVRDFNENGLLFPSRSFGIGNISGQVIWRPMRYNSALGVLHNPSYAGAYVYGRTKSQKHIDLELSNEITKRIRKIDINKWNVLRLGNHEGYITWEKYINNQQKIADNRNRRSEDRPGAIRAGAALLQGIARCGKCGRRIQVEYPKGKTHPIYFCMGTSIEYADSTYCQRFSGVVVDKMVADAFFQAIEPAQLQLSITALQRVEAEMQQVSRQWELQLENVRYKADLARRRFTSVEPENRLVARNLEREWNDALAEVERLKREQSLKITSRTLLPSEHQSILNLAGNIPKLWHAETTNQTDRKQLLRCLIKDVTVARADKNVLISIRWQTDVCTQVNVTLGTTGDSLRTELNTIDIIRKLSADHTNKEIAEHLNNLGVLSKTGLKFNTKRVGMLRHKYDMRRVRPGHHIHAPREDGRYSVRKAAEVLNVSKAIIASWCKQGRLDSIQLKPRAFLWIKLTPEKVTELKRT